MCMWQGPRPRFGTAKSSWEQGQTLDLKDSEPLGQNQAWTESAPAEQSFPAGAPRLAPKPRAG